MSRPPDLMVTSTEQRAAALVEIRNMHVENETLKAGRDQDRREIDKLTDRCDLLLEQFRDAEQQRKVAERKLIRLAGAMRNINVLTAEATEIMRSVADWEETEASTAEQTSARQMAERLAPPISEAGKTER